MNKNADGVVNIMNIIPEENEAESGDVKVHIFFSVKSLAERMLVY